jgi:hypothetical protein
MGTLVEMAGPAMHQAFLVLPSSMRVAVEVGLTREHQEKARMAAAMVR